MSLISMEFIIFVFGSVVGYYLIPKKMQWIWLLIFSYIYYCSTGIKFIFFILYTTLITFVTGLLLSKAGEGGNIIDEKRKKRKIIITALFFVFGMLAMLKYTNFAIENINLLFHMDIQLKHLLFPIGISFYTFQSAGYIMDVYWKRCEPERNIFRFALFISFFPQILQGPIGRYNRLAQQLYDEHRFDWKQIERGLQLIVWGFFKKLVIADTAAIFVNAIFDEYQTYKGIAIFGVLAYSAQLYGDFSGGIDVVIGIGRLFGIEMDQNFKRPYFANSITDFWHRWHITLGTWMKDYVFYPLSLSKFMGKFGKISKRICGKTYGRIMPICISNLVVFFLVGLWHGAAWKFIIYGLYNGVIIAFSGLMNQNYRKWKSYLHIKEKHGWRIFQITRTFILVNISWFFDRSDTVNQALIMMKNAVTQFRPQELLTINVGQSGSAFTVMALVILVLSCALLFVVSFFQEKGIHIREKIANKTWIIRWGIYLILVLSIPLLGQPLDTAGGFIYAQF